MTGSAERPRDTKPSRRAIVVGALPGFLLAACSSVIPGTGQPPQLYVLSRKTTFPPDLTGVSQQLLVDMPLAPAEIDTTRVALSRSPTTIDYFANAAWSDRAPAMVQSLLIESFEQTGRIVGVSRDEAGLRSDYVLLPELRRFQAIYASGDAPPTVHVRLLVRLVRMPDRIIVDELLSERREPTQRNGMDAIVEGFNDALGGVMKDIVVWTFDRIRRDAAQNGGRARP